MSSVIKTADQVKAWVQVNKKSEALAHEFKDFHEVLEWRDAIHKKCLEATNDDLYREADSSAFLFVAMEAADFVLRGKGGIVEIDAARKRAEHLCHLMIVDRSIRDCLRA